MKNHMKSLVALLLVLSFMFSQSFASDIVTAPSLSGGYDQLDSMIQNIKSNYYKEISDDKLREALYKGIFQALDPHSVYFTPDEYQAFNEKSEGSFTGIGISISAKNNYIEVISPIKNTPAFKAGIKSGDVIVAIDSVDIKGWNTDQVVQKIRGQSGTPVSLTIQRPGESKPIIFNLIRSVINILSVEQEVQGGIDIIRLTSWDQNTLIQLQEALKGKSFNNGLILDLRNNPGGLLSQVVSITDLFLKKGQRIMTVDYAKSQDDVYEANTGGLTMPLVVLINSGSASASEIFAGAIQDHKRGVLVGETSYGKGTVQGLLSLPDKGAMKLTIASYRTAADRDIDGKGITPDVKITNTTENETVVSKFYELQGLSTLKRGARSMEVIGAQQRLRYIGYAGPVDGVFGEALEKAVKVFQKQKALQVTGKIDIATRVELNKQAAEVGKAKVVDLQMAEAVKQLKKLTASK